MVAGEIRYVLAHGEVVPARYCDTFYNENTGRNYDEFQYGDRNYSISGPSYNTFEECREASIKPLRAKIKKLEEQLEFPPTATITCPGCESVLSMDAVASNAYFCPECWEYLGSE